MNLRQHKRAVVAKISHPFARGWILNRPGDSLIDNLTRRAEATWVGHPLFTAEEIMDQLRAATPEQPATGPFYCLKVKDDTIVGEFATREEALALVQKHARQKKAKLHVMHNGQPVLFTEEEMA